jgi:hypothetical protein
MALNSPDKMLQSDEYFTNKLESIKERNSSSSRIMMESTPKTQDNTDAVKL